MKKLFYLLFAVIIVSCSTKNENNNQSDDNITTEKTSISLSKEQIDIAGIKTGNITKQKIAETIECTGSIEVPPKNIASVSPVINGFIKKLNYLPGDFVEKGEVLAYLQHPDFISLQQQFIETKSQVDYYEQEFKRQGELTVENAASIKNMQKAKADYLTYEASYKSLKSQLEILGINTDEIIKGDFVKEFKLIAPISGYISQLNGNAGKYVDSQTCIYEIINDETLNLHLNVFEKEIEKVKVGQRIMFRSLNNSQKHESKVKRIGIKINESNRTSMVHGLIENKNHQLKPGMFINASIYISEKDAFVLPSEAIVDINNESYIFTQNNTEFDILKVKTGIEQNNMTEILDINDDLLKTNIVINGAYYLSSIFVAEE